MSNKIYTRVHNRKATEDSWSQLNPVLLDGEVILVSIEDTIRIKVGDGVTDYNNLPFIDDDIRADVEEALEALRNQVPNDHTHEITDIVGLQTALDSKISANLSSNDAGKVLGIDSQGNVVPTNALRSGLTWGDLMGTTE